MLSYDIFGFSCLQAGTGQTQGCSVNPQGKRARGQLACSEDLNNHGRCAIADLLQASPTHDGKVQKQQRRQRLSSQHSPPLPSARLEGGYVLPLSPSSPFLSLRFLCSPTKCLARAAHEVESFFEAVPVHLPPTRMLGLSWTNHETGFLREAQRQRAGEVTLLL